MRTAYSIIQLLQQRTSDLEQENKSRRHDAAIYATASSKCLLLGDTNTRRVFHSDLDDKCIVKTVTHANIDLLRSWVTEQLQSVPSECVILGGVYDIFDELSPDIILDHLGSLISDLKEKNNEMKIRVCQVVPVPEPQEIQAKVKYYNEQLLEWGEANGINIVKTAPEFTLGTRNVDEWCFDIEDKKPCILNRMGVIKLLSVLEKQCSGFNLCKNWASIQRQLKISLSTRLGDTRNGDRPQPQSTVASIIPSNAPTHRPPLLPTPTHAASAPSRTHPHSYAAAAKRSPPHNVDAGWGKRWMDESGGRGSGTPPESPEIELDCHSMESTSTQPNVPHTTHYTQLHTPHNTHYTQPHITHHTHYTQPYKPHHTQPHKHGNTYYTRSNTPQYTHYTQPRALQNTHHTTFTTHSPTHHSTHSTHSPVHHTTHTTHSPTHHTTHITHGPAYLTILTTHSPTHHTAHTTHSPTHLTTHTTHSPTYCTTHIIQQTHQHVGSTVVVVTIVVNTTIAKIHVVLTTDSNVNYVIDLVTNRGCATFTPNRNSAKKVGPADL